VLRSERQPTDSSTTTTWGLRFQAIALALQTVTCSFGLFVLYIAGFRRIRTLSLELRARRARGQNPSGARSDCESRICCSRSSSSPAASLEMADEVKQQQQQQQQQQQDRKPSTELPQDEDADDRPG
jgi:hypothetical protein